MNPHQTPDPDSVRQWRARLRDGDVEAFAALFNSHVDRVHRLAVSLCGDPVLAEDITGDTFLAVWRRRVSIANSDEPLGPWLLAIAARQSLNATRGRRRQYTFVARHGHRLIAAEPDIADVVSRRLDSAEQLNRTQRAMQHLNARELEVLALCVWSELSTGEAAKALNVSEGTVRSRLHRARNRLRALAQLTAGPTPPFYRPRIHVDCLLEERR